MYLWVLNGGRWLWPLAAGEMPVLFVKIAGQVQAVRNMRLPMDAAGRQNNLEILKTFSAPFSALNYPKDEY